MKKARNQETSISTWAIIIIAFLILVNLLFNNEKSATKVDSSNNSLDSINYNYNYNYSYNDNSVKTIEEKLSYSISNETEDIGKIFKESNESMSVYTACVTLSRKASFEELESLSKRIRNGNLTEAKGIRHYFYLPEMDVNGGAWATTVFNPNMHVSILGKTIEDDISINNYAKKPNKEYIGQWKDSEDQPHDLIKRIKHIRKNQYSIEIFSPSDNESRHLANLVKNTINNVEVYTESQEDFPEQYYIINKNGDLECYDSQGLIVTMKKIN